jgi:outer membrane protein assembly factor BamB
MKEIQASMVALPALLVLASLGCHSSSAGEARAGSAPGPLAESGSTPQQTSSEGEVVAPAGSWPAWRGFGQDGRSLETGLVDAVALEGEGANLLWTHDLRGRGAPVVFGGRVFGMGYEGTGQDLQEVLYCLDEQDGSTLWELRFTDFLSDAVYDRYSITSPVVDVTSGNVVFMTTPGILGCVTSEGEWVWQHDLLTEFGRLTFPNSLVGAPVIDDDLVVIHMINSHWGPTGPARDRVYAFDKDDGRHVWTSTPGETPVDNSMATPVFDWVDGRRVLYFGTGCGNLTRYPASDRAPGALYKRAYLNQEAGRDDAARQMYNQVIKDYPNSLEAKRAQVQLGTLIKR